MNDGLELLYEHCIKATEKPFFILGGVSVHLEESILLLFIERYDRFTDRQKVGLLIALMPRKRLTDTQRPLAKQFVALGVLDLHPFIQNLSSMVLSTIEKSTMETSVDLASFQTKMSSFKSNIPPLEILFQSSKSHKKQEAVGGVTFKDDFKRPSKAERYLIYFPKEDNMELQPTLPPITARKKSDIFVPKFDPTPKTIRRISSYKKDTKVKMMDFDEVAQVNDKIKQVKDEKRTAKQEKEDAKAERQKVAEDKKRKRQLSEETKRPKKLSSADTNEIIDNPSYDSHQAAVDRRFTNSRMAATSPSVIVQSPPKIEPQTDLKKVIDVDEILKGAYALSPEDRETIATFLRGKYGNIVITLEAATKIEEYKLTEPKPGEKRESFWIILDYGKCSWKKLKRTKKATN